MDRSSSGNESISVDEDGLFDITDEEVLAEIAGGLSAAPTILDNHCTHNKSECGKSANRQS